MALLVGASATACQGPPLGETVLDGAVPDAPVVVVDADTSADARFACVGPPDPNTPLTPEEYDRWVGGYCEHVCGEMSALCSDDPYQIANHGEFMDAVCHADCHHALIADPSLIPNYHCHAGTCEANWNCIEAPPFAVPQECTDFCTMAYQCGAESLFELRGGIENCALLCAGEVQAGEFGTQAACMAARFADGCDLLGATACIPFLDWECEHVCGPIDGHHGQLCTGDTAYGMIFPDMATCQTMCHALTVPQAVGVKACLAATDCDGAAACWPPAAPLPACAALCDQILGACPTFSAGGEASLCQAWCSQLASLHPGFPACTDTVTRCPNTPDDLLSCTIGGPPQCHALCETMGCCGLTISNCLGGCSELAAAMPAELETIYACSEAALTCAEAVACVPQ